MELSRYFALATSACWIVSFVYAQYFTFLVFVLVIFFNHAPLTKKLCLCLG